MNMELSEKERELFDAIKSRKSVTLDELLKKVKSNARAANARHAMIVRVNYLTGKVARHGWIIENTGGIGRGAKAIYSVKKRF
jgi:hypothetical protein